MSKSYTDFLKRVKAFRSPKHCDKAIASLMWEAYREGIKESELEIAALKDEVHVWEESDAASLVLTPSIVGRIARQDEREGSAVQVESFACEATCDHEDCISLKLAAKAIRSRLVV